MSELITIQGTARSGKGTLAAGVAEHLSTQGHQVAAIDVGLKFRVFAKRFMEDGGDFGDDGAIDRYLQRPEFREEVLTVFEEVQTMTPQERERIYHSKVISENVSRIGTSARAQSMVGELRDEEIKRAVMQDDVTIVDGRMLYDHGIRLEQELGATLRYLLGVDVVCSPKVAAERVLRKRLGREPSFEELVTEAGSIDARNRADSAPGRVEQMRPIEGASWLDIVDHKLDIDREARIVSSVGNRAVWLDNSLTKTPEQLITPVAKLIDLLKSQR